MSKEKININNKILKSFEDLKCLQMHPEKYIKEKKKNRKPENNKILKGSMLVVAIVKIIDWII